MPSIVKTSPSLKVKSGTQSPFFLPKRLPKLSSLESFGVSVLAPYSPFILNDLQDGFIMSFYDDMKLRPLSLNKKNICRRRFD